MIQRIISLVLIVFFFSVSLANCGSGASADSKRKEAVSESESAETDELEDSDSSEGNSLLAKNIAFYSENGDLLCGILLSAEQTQYFVGEEGVLTLTISLPQYVLNAADEEEVILENNSGHVIGTYALSDFAEDANGYYSTTRSFEFNTDTHMSFGLKAACGEYYSPWLEIDVTPEITADQIADCAVIGAELNDAMAEDYADVSERERAEAAKAWLEKDERILKTYLSEADTTVYYVTADYVSGAYNAAGNVESDDPLQDYSGINDGSSWDYLDNGFLTDLYNEYGFNQIEKNNIPLRLATHNSAVSTNPNALLLVPCPDDMGTQSKDYIQSLKEDYDRYVAATGGEAKVLSGTDAVEAIFNHSLNDYGMVTLFTHGQTMTLFKEPAGGSETIYLMYRSETFTEDTKKSVHESAKKKLEEFAHLAYPSDENGSKNEKSFYSKWYSDPDSFFIEDAGSITLGFYSKKLILSTAFSEGGNYYEIWMSSGFIQSWYQNQWFDNAVIYLATCKGLLDTQFDEWFLNRGCRYVFGFTVKVRTIANVDYHRVLFNHMLEATEEHPNRFRTVQEAVEEIGVIDPADWGLDEEVEEAPPVWFGQIGPLSTASEQNVTSGHVDNTLYYVGQNDYIFKGHGELKGHVKWLELDVQGFPVGDPDDADVAAGATVHAYLLRDRTFTEFEGNEVTTNENGEFVIPDCPMGYLVLTAEAKGIKSMPYQICFVDDSWDGGDLYLPKPEGLVASACIGKYRGQLYKLRQAVGDIDSLPTTAAKYDYICSFAFYNGKVYYCCKESGTSDYYMALYESNLDGTVQKELYAPTRTDIALNRFAIKDGLLYYYDFHWSGSNRVYDYYQIDLNDGSNTAAPNPPADVVKVLTESSGYYAFEKDTFYTSGGSLPGMPLQIVWEKEDGSTETLVTGEVSVKLEGVFPADAPGDYDIYYSTFIDGGQSAALYRLRLSTRENVQLDSHMAVGGGAYFNW